jgi:hypothetical protein
MPRNLNKSEKTAFLKKRIADAEYMLAGTVKFVEKNYQLFSQKVETLNQLRRQRSNSPTWLSGPSEREQKLSRQVSDFRERLRIVEQFTKWIENDKQASINNRNSNSGAATPAQIQKFAGEMGWVEKPAKKPKREKRKAAQVKSTPSDSNVVNLEKFKIYKAKAEALDNRAR